MIVRLAITCLPILLVLWAWGKAYRVRHEEPLNPPSLIALIIVTALAGLAAGAFIYLEFRPDTRPPWESTEILLYGSFFLLSPIGMIFGYLASKRGAPRWLNVIVFVVLIWLFLLGVLAGMWV